MATRSADIILLQATVEVPDDLDADIAAFS
jgi:hypothetical protein